MRVKKILSEIFFLLVRLFVLAFGFFCFRVADEWWEKALSVFFIVLATITFWMIKGVTIMANEMRDRLVELIETAKKEWWEKSGRYQTSKASADYIADCLLDDGWVRPPFKVGQRVYAIYLNGELRTALQSDRITQIIINRGGYHFKCWWGYFHLSDIGKTVFLTKEEAEQKLKEMRGNNEKNTDVI